MELIYVIEMRILDGDVHALQSGNIVACRDIVQFVRYSRPFLLIISCSCSLYLYLLLLL